MSERDALLLEMLEAAMKRAEYNGAGALHLGGFRDAIAVVEEWRGLFHAPPTRPKDPPPPADVGCSDEALAQGA